jgi:hypothetical protein
MNSGRYCYKKDPEPVLVNVYGAQESIPRNQFRQWWVGTTITVVVSARHAGNRFLGSLKGLQRRALANILIILVHILVWKIKTKAGKLFARTFDLLSICYLSNVLQRPWTAVILLAASSLAAGSLLAPLG